MPIKLKHARGPRGGWLLPETEVPTAATSIAQAWAYRIGTLPFEATVEDVALLIQGAIDEARREGTA